MGLLQGFTPDTSVPSPPTHPHTHTPGGCNKAPGSIPCMLPLGSPRPAHAWLHLSLHMHDPLVWKRGDRICQLGFARSGGFHDTHAARALAACPTLFICGPEDPHHAPFALPCSRPLSFPYSPFAFPRVLSPELGTALRNTDPYVWRVMTLTSLAVVALAAHEGAVDEDERLTAGIEGDLLHVNSRSRRTRGRRAPWGDRKRAFGRFRPFFLSIDPR